MTPLEFIYYIGYALKKRHSLKNQKRLPDKVLSIGNITVGGTGKTPAAVAFAVEAKKRGFRPVILTRGYRGKAAGPCFVRTDGQTTGPATVCTVGDAGDEPLLMADRLEDVPVVKCADRYEGGMFAKRSLPSVPGVPFLFILDDGFQHWRIYRDIDVVLIDGTNPFGNRRMLPSGRLRGPLKELKQADFFIITKARNEELAGELKDIKKDAQVFFSEYRTEGIRDINNNELPAAFLKDKKIYSFCGIANPEAFRQTLGPLCGRLERTQPYRDHYSYSQKDVDRLVKQAETLGCDIILTTGKDMVKLKSLQIPENLLCLEISFVMDDTAFDSILNRPG